MHWLSLAVSQANQLLLTVAAQSQSPRGGGNGNGMKSFDEIVTDKAVTDEGVFNVHKVDDKYYFEISNDLLEREMLLVTRVSGSTENFSFGGAGQKHDLSR